MDASYLHGLNFLLRLCNLLSTIQSPEDILWQFAMSIYVMMVLLDNHVLAIDNRSKIEKYIYYVIKYKGQNEVLPNFLPNGGT